MHRRRFIIIVALILLFGNSANAEALELTVSDNGSGSTSEVVIQEETQTQVEQSNTSEIENSIDSSAVTGTNESSQNTSGDTSIDTGDASNQVLVENNGNVSTAETGCCQASSEARISDNGSGSQNQLSVNQTTTSTVNVDQNVVINNNIKGYANTGNNTANDNNNGNVAINTGNINASSQIINSPVNATSVEATVGSGDLTATIDGNGANSQNILESYLNNITNTYINSSAEIDNFVIWDLNTGGNSASHNSGGNVSITTGDIDLYIFIENLANIGFVNIDCCEFEIYDPGEDMPDTPDIGGNESPNDSSSGSDGQVLSAAAAAEAGGPGISGLSDTSSASHAKNILFWFGLAIFTLGLKYLIEGLTSERFIRGK